MACLSSRAQTIKECARDCKRSTAWPGSHATVCLGVRRRVVYVRQQVVRQQCAPAPSVYAVCTTSRASNLLTSDIFLHKHKIPAAASTLQPRRSTHEPAAAHTRNTATAQGTGDTRDSRVGPMIPSPTKLNHKYSCTEPTGNREIQSGIPTAVVPRSIQVQRCTTTRAES